MTKVCFGQKTFRLAIRKRLCSRGWWVWNRLSCARGTELTELIIICGTQIHGLTSGGSRAEPGVGIHDPHGSLPTRGMLSFRALSSYAPQIPVHSPALHTSPATAGNPPGFVPAALTTPTALKPPKHYFK